MAKFDWKDLSDQAAFDAWRAAKIRFFEYPEATEILPLESFQSPADGEIAALRARIDGGNFAVFDLAHAPSDLNAACNGILTLAGAFGLSLPESHRSAENAGVVVLQTSDDPSKRGFIPYTKRGMNWHTDGYYNPPDNPVRSFILYCHQQANAGGENQLLDPEVAYMRLREENPDYVRALMHPQAMTIPENREADGSIRPTSVGPVFFGDEKSGRLHMRFTARTRSIAWRDDETTRKALAFLMDWLASDDPLIRSLRLSPGQGIISNNALHNRTQYEDSDAAPEKRTVLRLRFHDRI